MPHPYDQDDDRLIAQRQQTECEMAAVALPDDDTHDLLIAHGYVLTRFDEEGPEYPAFWQYETPTEYLYAYAIGAVHVSEERRPWL